LSMILYVLKNPIYKTWLHVKDKQFGLSLFKQIFIVGLPSGMQYFFEVGAFAGAAIMIGWFGKEQLAAHQIAINIASVTYMVATGFSAAGSILVGEAWGRKDKSDMIKAGRASLIMGFGFMALMALVFAFGNELLVSFYTTDTAVAPMAANLLLIAALFQLSDGVQCVSLGILRGIADTKVPTIITIVAYWVIGIPSGWLMAKYANLSLNGIWFGLCAGLTFSAFMLSIRFLKESKSFQFVADMKKHYKELVNEA
jgi:MATE family multidrug resistance protein